jgi:hypothetical protein
MSPLSQGSRSSVVERNLYRTVEATLLHRLTCNTNAKKKLVGLERSPLSLVSSTEELLDRKVAAPA